MTTWIDYDHLAARDTDTTPTAQVAAVPPSTPDEPFADLSLAFRAQWAALRARLTPPGRPRSSTK